MDSGLMNEAANVAILYTAAITTTSMTLGAKRQDRVRQVMTLAAHMYSDDLKAERLWQCALGRG